MSDYATILATAGGTLAASLGTLLLRDRLERHHAEVAAAAAAYRRLGTRAAVLLVRIEELAYATSARRSIGEVGLALMKPVLGTLLSALPRGPWRDPAHFGPRDFASLAAFPDPVDRSEPSSIAMFDAIAGVVEAKTEVDLYGARPVLEAAETLVTACLALAGAIGPTLPFTSASRRVLEDRRAAIAGARTAYLLAVRKATSSNWRRTRRQLERAEQS